LDILLKTILICNLQYRTKNTQAFCSHLYYPYWQKHFFIKISRNVHKHFIFRTNYQISSQDKG